MKVWVQDWADGYSLHLKLEDLRIYRDFHSVAHGEPVGFPYDVELKEPIEIDGSGLHVESLPSHQIHVVVTHAVKPQDGSETLPVGKYLAADLKHLGGRLFTFRVVSPDLGDKRRIGVLREWSFLDN